MKKTLLFAAILLALQSFSQTLAPPIDFESATINYTFTNFDGGVVTVINNPQSNGTNTSSKVGQMVKNAGQPWGGSLIAMTNPIDFTTNRIFKMKVYSPRVGARVLLKVENNTNGAIFYEKEDTSSVANAWETLTFDMTAIDTSKSYQKIVLIWDLGTMGDGSANFTFLFDDIELIQGTLPTKSIMNFPITWDDTANVNYSVIDFGGNASVGSTDPMNPADMVLKSTKTTGSQTWAGTSFGSRLSTAIPFAASNTTISARVYSPDANIQVRLKAEDSTNPNISVETEATVSTANAWNTLTFDFSNEVMGTAAINFANTYDKLSIFYDFGTPGANKDYYVDNIVFGTLSVNIEEQRLSTSKLSLYPNPAKDQLTVDLSNVEGYFTMKIFNVNGQLVQSFENKDRMIATFDINELEAGMYFIQVTSAKEVYTNQFIKE